MIRGALMRGVGRRAGSDRRRRLGRKRPTLGLRRGAGFQEEERAGPVRVVAGAHVAAVVDQQFQEARARQVDRDEHEADRRL